MPSPEYVVIKSDGVETARLPLNEDCTYRIGDGNTIEISGGSVRMSFAPQAILCVLTRILAKYGGKDASRTRVERF